MVDYLIRRLFSALLVIIGVTTLVFLLIHLVPGDPVEVILGETVHQGDAELLREKLGLNLPIFQQWLNFLTGMARLDLGQSLYTLQPVIHVIAEKIPATIFLAITSLTFAIFIAIPLGIIAAIRRGTGWDVIAMSFSVTGISIPNFWMGPILVLVFSIALGWLPVSGNQGIVSVILPAITLGTALAAILSRMVRSALLEVLQEDYIRAAQARGVSEKLIIIKHALPNAALPIITVLGFQMGSLLAGAVITETIFSWPGIGQLTIEAIQKRDYPVVQGCILLISLTYVMINLITDLVYTWVDPRIKLEQ